MSQIGRYLREVVVNETGVSKGTLSLDVVVAHHRAAPPIQQARAFLQLLDIEDEDGGLATVLLEQIQDVGIIRGGRIRQINVVELLR
jgi:hypothetical protein